MLIETFKVGPLETNCYLVACEDTKEAAIIDPGDEGEKIIDYVKENNFSVKYIINTHGHWDHIGDNGLLQEKLAAELLIHEDDVSALEDPSKNLSRFLGNPNSSVKSTRTLKDGDIIKIGTTVELKVIHTPGHTEGSICLLGNKVLFSGDTLFYGSIGRTDFPGSSPSKMAKSLEEKIIPLDDDITVYPGHGPSTNMKTEKETNPYLR